MFVDMVASTEFALRVDDSSEARLFRRFEQVTADIVQEQCGRLVERHGDGTLSIFNSARAGLRAATQLQELLKRETLIGEAVTIRIGLHTGDLVVDDDAVFGLAVHRASRIADLGEAGDILVSRTTLGAAGENCGFRFDHRTDVLLKGFPAAEPVYVVDVGRDDNERLMAVSPPSSPSSASVEPGWADIGRPP